MSATMGALMTVGDVDGTSVMETSLVVVAMPGDTISDCFSVSGADTSDGVRSPAASTSIGVAESVPTMDDCDLLLSASAARCWL
jgi:hypothetical protein